jgi:hypothetical protein
MEKKKPIIESFSHITLIGIDCAVQPRNIGLALGRLIGNSVSIDKLVVGNGDPAQYISNIIADSNSVLLAFDSPLGWPKPVRRQQ